MSAAALRPDLFSHLFASRPERPDGGSLAASALSIALHAAAVALLVWASVNVQKLVRPATAEPTIVIAIPTTAEQSAATAERGDGAASREATTPTVFNPVVTPGEIPPVDVPLGTPGFETPLPSDQTPGNAPAAAGGGDIATRDGFRISTVIPALHNAAEVRAALERNYPSILRDAGIGGQVIVWLLIDEAGRVAAAEVKESSGHKALDGAALGVAEIMRFNPAQNRDQRVKVWVALPIVFRAR